MAAKKNNTTAAPKLAPLRVKMLEKPVKTGDVVTVMVEDDYPTRYNEASAIAKKAAELMTNIKPAMLPDAMARVFGHNADKPWEPIVSVAFQDDTGSVTRISCTNKYPDITAEIAEALFQDLKVKPADPKGKAEPADVNNYMARTVVANFDSTVFQGADGKFDQERYDKIVKALDGVCKELDVKNPLSTAVVVKPLPSFSTRRWTDFDLATNIKIAKVLPNQFTFTPCPNAKTGLMAGEEPQTEEK